MKISILAITREAARLGERLRARLPGSRLLRCRGNSIEAIREAWGQSDALVCIMASGIVVRAVSPLVADKYRDPAVIVLDQQGRYVIPLLSGHVGGANALARRIASITGGQAVMTTASDCTGHTALDLWIRKYCLKPWNSQLLPVVMGRLVDRGQVRIYSDSGLPALPWDMVETNRPGEADIIITIRPGMHKAGPGALVLHPSVIVAGIGCNRGTPAPQIIDALDQTLVQAGLARDALCCIATIDIKQDEQGIIETAMHFGVETLFFPAEQLNSVQGTKRSDAVFRATGAHGVCEPAAILGARGGKLLVEKRKWKDVTTAIALAAWPWWEPARGPLTS